jgi:hypothetical protein
MGEESTMPDKLTRRQFVRNSAGAAAALATGCAGGIAARAEESARADTAKILNYNPDMEYRRLGKTGLTVSAVALGGHWKRLVKIIGGWEMEGGWMTEGLDRPEFLKNRSDVVTRCIERGINYVAASCREEILAYAQALKGRRDKMYFGYSWAMWESRFPEWRSAAKLKEGLDAGMKEAGLDYVDLWGITLLEQSSQHAKAELEAAVEALDWAKRTGRARFTGISSHDRSHIKKMIETYPQQMDAILTPYTAKSKVIARWIECRVARRDPKRIVCTDCHGNHRLKIRTVRWDRKTGKLLPAKPREVNGSKAESRLNSQRPQQ